MPDIVTFSNPPGLVFRLLELVESFPEQPISELLGEPAWASLLDDLVLCKAYGETIKTQAQK